LTSNRPFAKKRRKRRITAIAIIEAVTSRPHLLFNEEAAMRSFITALMLLLALLGSMSMIALAFRADFQELAADNGGDRTTWERPRPNSE
jgi:hypothetical protein